MQGNCSASKTKIYSQQTEKLHQYRNNDADSKLLNSKKKSQKALEKHLQILKGNKSSEILEPAKLLFKSKYIYIYIDALMKILEDIILIIFP